MLFGILKNPDNNFILISTTALFSASVGAKLVTLVGFDDNRIVGEIVTNTTSTKTYWIGKYFFNTTNNNDDNAAVDDEDDDDDGR